MNTRKYPRTLNEAFGPYTSRDFTEPRDPKDVITTTACVLAGVALIVLMVLA